MRWVLFSALSGVLYGQSALLRLADSLTVYGKPVEALSLYDSVLRLSAASDSLYIRIYLGSLRPLILLQKWNELHTRADTILHLTQATGDSLSYAKCLSALGEALTRQNKYDTAELALERAHTLFRSHLSDSAEYALLLHRMGVLREFQERYEDAAQWYREALAMRTRIPGTGHPDYAWTLIRLAGVYSDLSLYREAEILYLEAREIRARILGTDHQDYAGTLIGLANTYYYQGRYPEAGNLYQEAREIYMRMVGTDHPHYASTLYNLALLYFIQGQYVESEKLYLETKDIRARVVGTDHPDYASALNSLAVVYAEQGRYAEAEKLYSEARAIYARTVGIDHTDYARTLSNLANAYADQGQHTEAEKLYLEARAIRARVAGTDHPDYARTLNNLAVMYSEQKRYPEAEKLHLEARAIYARAVGTDHPDYASTLNNLANVYYLRGQYAEAEKIYLEVKDILSRTLGTDHPDYYSYVLSNLARLYARQSRYKEADPLWNEVIRKSFARINRDFLSMPTAYRQQLLENVLWNDLRTYQRYVAMRREKAFIKQGYRVARSVKGLLLASTEAMKWLVESRKGDSTLQQLYETWRRLSEQYAYFTFLEDYGTADSLWQQATQTEKALVERLPELATFFPDLEKEPLFPPLKRGEVAIEVVRVPAEREDSVLYLFYIIEGGKKAIRLHVHLVDTLWEKRALSAYEILRSPGTVLTGIAYQLLWREVDSLLPGGVRVIQFSPDGIYHQVNVASLYDGKGFIIDRYNVRYVATTRRLLIKRPKPPATQPAVIGNPDFGSAGSSTPESRARSYRAFPYGIPPLPGSEAEAIAIARLLGIEPITGSAATEGYVRALYSPRVLHIATHGYFEGTGKNPMLEGGLLLAQAALWDSLYPPLGADDGRLTAQEASTLNLLGTDLVVLSACETGLGKVKGEGLYGLQRAFLEAGAGRVITTLWQIDDEATRMLMEDFYRRWRTMTGTGAQPAPTGKAAEPAPESLIDTAFNETLRDFRKRYAEPYYWGAFVLMR